MRQHRWVVLAATVALMGALTLPRAGGDYSEAVAGSLAKKVCKTKTVKKKVHGHTKKVKVRTCHTVKPAPKPTATARPTATQIPNTIAVSMGPAFPGITYSQSSGVYEFTYVAYGDQLEINKVAIAQSADVLGNLTVSMRVRIAKLPSAMDGDVPDWVFPTSLLTLTAASNQHPYGFSPLVCPDNEPRLPGADLYSGETAQGWVCTEVPRQYATGRYALTWTPDRILPEFTIATILNVDITVPPSAT